MQHKGPLGTLVKSLITGLFEALGTAWCQKLNNLYVTMMSPSPPLLIKTFKQKH